MSNFSGIRKNEERFQPKSSGGSDAGGVRETSRDMHREVVVRTRRLCGDFVCEETLQFRLRPRTSYPGEQPPLLEESGVPSKMLRFDGTGMKAAHSAEERELNAVSTDKEWI